VRVTTDIGFWNVALRFAAAHHTQNGAPVYMYEARWTTPCFSGRWAPHGIELPFLFNRPRYGIAWDGADSEEVRDQADPTGVRFKIGDLFLRAWLGFLRTGDPSTREIPWPVYDTSEQRTAIFDAHSRVEAGVRSAVRSDVTALTIS